MNDLKNTNVAGMFKNLQFDVRLVKLLKTYEHNNQHVSITFTEEGAHIFKRNNGQSFIV